MAHGYLRDYDEDRDRGETHDEERGWRGDDRDGRRPDQQSGNERNRNFMIGDRDRSWERSHGGDYPRSAFSNDRSRERSLNEDRSGRSGGAGDWERSPRNFSSHQDDHYRSWRDRQMKALDQDYENYCREREQQFHSDFDSWRSQRRDSSQPLRTGMTQTGAATDPAGMPDITTDLETSSQSKPAMADSTVGTSTSRNSR
jgi:hypothetical protein